MTLQEAQQAVDAWIREFGVRYYSELTNMAILTEEVGEVARLMARMYGEQSFKTAEQAATAKDDLAEEMGDVLFVLLCLANQTGIDLQASLQKIMDKRAVRDKDRHAQNPKLKG